MPEDKFSRAAAATESAGGAQTAARESAYAAIQMMFKALELALASSHLRGLPNLSSSALPYRGVRVTSRKTSESLPRATDASDAREALCISDMGVLEFVCLTRDSSIRVRPVPAEEYRAEWTEDVAEAILATLNYHMAGCDKTARRYSKLKRLSDRMISALNGADS